MELVIHGTKGGYRILFKTRGAPSIGSDIRNNVSSEEALGKSAYSIAFSANGYVFTKYIIIRDSLRSDATGFIAFSLFLSSNKELLNKGCDVKEILDELSNQYLDKYVRNNSINKGETEIIQEDWTFVNNILDRKTEQNRSYYDVEIEPGIKEAALLFYQDDLELQEYFSKPFQEEYNGYKQILLINAELHNRSADLLKALRNSREELKVDLKNDPFYLNNYNPSQRLSVTSNGKPRSDRKKNNVIRAKEKIEIKYTKEHYYPLEVTGTLSNPNSDIHKYLGTRGNQILIKYEVLSAECKPIEKVITFDIKDWKGYPLEGVEINYKSDAESKSIISNKIIFCGAEIGRLWTISANKPHNLFSDIIQITPENENHVKVVLNECKKIKFEGQLKTEYDFRSFPDIRISIQEKNINKSPNTEVEFINDEIHREFKAIATYSEVNRNLYGEVYFYPKDIKDGNPIVVNLKQETSRTPSITYYVDEGKHGRASAGFSYKEDGSDIKIRETKGYIFIGFKLDKKNKPNNYNGTLIAQYKKKKLFFQNSKFIAGCIIGSIILGVGISALYPFFKSQLEQKLAPNRNSIKDYIEGDSLLLNTLNSFKETLEVEGQTEVLNSLDSGIQKREFINSWNFDSLRTLHYYPAQQEFEAAIKKIDSTQYDAVEARLGNVSSWDLKRIADSINFVLKLSKPSVEKKPTEEEKVKEKKREQSQQAVVQPSKPEQKNLERPILSPAITNKTTEIIQYLKGDELKREELNKYLKDVGSNSALKNSINLCLKFWDLDGSKSKSYSSFLHEIGNEINLKNSKLKSFVENMTSKQNPKYPSQLPGTKVVTTLKQIQEKILE
jgi:hypothetical protein